MAPLLVSSPGILANPAIGHPIPALAAIPSPPATRHPPFPLPVAFLATPRDVFRLALSSGPRFPTASGMSFIQNCSIGYRGIPAPTGRAT